MTLSRSRAYMSGILTEDGAWQGGLDRFHEIGTAMSYW